MPMTLLLAEFFGEKIELLHFQINLSKNVLVSFFELVQTIELFVSLLFRLTESACRFSMETFRLC